MLPKVAGMTGMHHHTQIFLLRWGLMKFLTGLALNHDPPTLHLPSSYNYGHEPLAPGLEVE
jgi:hypothetical protein